MPSYSKIAEGFYASGQIAPEDLAEIAGLGVRTIVNNRPDGEGGPEQPTSEEMGAAAVAAGLAYHYLPMTPQSLSPELLERFRAVVEGSPGPVLAHCKSGARSTALWALSETCHNAADIDATLEKARAGGYDLGGMRPMIEQYIAWHEVQRGA
ncbi:TIGR01244 family protein [Tistlia consotensis]|uniref:Sulfide:quinone oxidoreductase n=1 Tax=Tistlia consotensis USBA 355 TaxID=560819 RepID=A0A1Y6C3H7_9PROT|nr:TIGR01244 family sulfur transferase [Tistlia consotensis]SMF43485.1 sulfide:quinone oxidoreductase [Tistlia consotensis USBA 355]SNR42593.1 TIGR01244 family protein [Tistlia consotensis]